jgi:1,4-dihydroxy-2-naphthoate polyprenyltransferase
MAHPEWIPRLLRSIDERDWDTFVSHLTEDAEFRYGSGQTAVGRESIRSAADQAVSPFAAVEHELVDVWERPDSTVVQGKVTYQWPDGHRQTLPFLNLFSMRDSLITKYLIFIDPSPLFRPRPGSMAAYMGVARAPFLLLPFMLVAAGAAAQGWAGGFHLGRTLLALVGLIAMHIAVNALNEASDYDTGIDLETMRTPFSGGSGTLPDGLLDGRRARALGYGALLVGALAAGWLFLQIGRPLVPLVLAGLVLVLGYTPWFTRLGIGELAAGLGLGYLPVIGTAVVQTGDAATAAVAAALPAFFMTFNLLLLNEFPDEQADRAGGRRNLVLMAGRRGAARIYVGAAALTLLSIAAFVAQGIIPVWCLLALLPAWYLRDAVRWALGDPSRAVPIGALAGNVFWNLGTNLMLAIGFVLAMVL